MEGLWARPVAAAQSSGQVTHDCVHLPLVPAVQRDTVQLQRGGLSSGKVFKKLQMRHWSPRASIRDVERMLRSGDIPTIPPQNAKSLLTDDKSPYKLLDVRPQWEREKAYVVESIHVPLFVEDEATDAVTLLKKQIQFGFGGAWLGQKFTKQNMDFVEQVRQAIPNKNDKIMVACGEGMRSMMAIKELRKAGYTELAWVGGGFNNVRDGDFVTVENGTKLQWATVGGASELFLKFAVFLSAVTTSITGSLAVKDEPK
uniref:Rhodanese domain-containing protein n=3 Tax=Physcomitrium patens TaxID=3218 RepID=A9TJL4_PHYPA|nr:hypothetical protein PHYPA_013291 [Physcomitrium patens]